MAPGGVRDAIRYGFAVGRVRVLETRLLGQPTFERLLDAPDFEEQRRILSDTWYGRYLESAGTTDGVESALDGALEDAYGFLRTANLPDSVIGFFGARYDYRNLTAMLQVELLGVSPEGMFVERLGLTPAEVFEPGRPERLPKRLREVYERVRAIEQASPDSETIGRLVDEAMFADLLTYAKSSKSRYLQGLARLMIDLANLRATVRARLRGRPPKEAAEQIVPGGGIPGARMLDLYDAPQEEIAAEASRHVVLRSMRPEELVDPSRLDVIADNVVVNYVRKARAVPVGPEPVIAYVMAREAEIGTLKLLLMGRLARIPSERLRERLREAHV